MTDDLFYEEDSEFSEVLKSAKNHLFPPKKEMINLNYNSIISRWNKYGNIENYDDLEEMFSDIFGYELDCVCYDLYIIICIRRIEPLKHKLIDFSFEYDELKNPLENYHLNILYNAGYLSKEDCNILREYLKDYFLDFCGWHTWEEMKISYRQINTEYYMDKEEIK